MGKKKKQAKLLTKGKPGEEKTATMPTPSVALAINDKQALLITMLFAGISYVFSYFYTSFYQGEEGAQYMNALGFWHSPDSILGNWPKTGWKIIYAPVVLLGKQGVLIANCLFSAFTCFFTYKIAIKVSGKKTMLPMILLFSQTLWFLLSFKFYSEILTAFELSVAIYFYYCNRYLLFSIFISYVLVLRQEFIFLIPFFAIILLRKKKWAAFFLLALFPLLYNLWGWAATGDWLYSIHESQRTAALYKSSYPRQGFDHYFLMSGTIFNYIVITLVVTYLAQVIFRQIKKVEYPLLVPAIGYFLLHCLFNLQSMSILTSTGGNLRYLLVISPLMAVIAAQALYNLETVSKKLLPLVFLVPLFLLVAARLSYPHNWITLDFDSDQRDFLPPFFCAATIILITVFASARKKILTISGLCVLSMLLTIKSKKLCCDENFEQQKIAEYIKGSKLDSKPVYQNLALFNYFTGKNPWDFPAGNFSMNGDSTLEHAPKGAIVIWDSHYATKYGKVELDYFNKNTTGYKLLKQFVSDDKSFMALVFEKIKEPPIPVSGK